MLTVGGTENVAVCIEGHQVSHLTTNKRELGNYAVVHEDMATENKGVGVHGGDGTATAGSNVREDTIGLSVFAERAEVEVVYRRRF